MSGAAGLPKSALNLTGPLLYMMPITVNSQDFAAEGRWWHLTSLGPNSKTSDGVILFGAPIEDVRVHTAAMVGVAIFLSMIVGLIALMMARSLGHSVSKPMRIITYRVAELIAQKRSLPPLEGLEGEWLELGEKIDTALSEMRNSVKNLRTQLNKQAEVFEDRDRENQEESTVQLDTLNRPDQPTGTAKHRDVQTDKSGQPAKHLSATQTRRSHAGFDGRLYGAGSIRKRTWCQPDFLELDRGERRRNSRQTMFRPGKETRRATKRYEARASFFDTWRRPGRANKSVLSRRGNP